MNKQAIIDALRAFTCQRPGFDLGNYATMADYRSDYRRTLRDRGIALQLLRDIELRDSITAEDILAECGGGRVQIKDISAHYDDGSTYHKYSIDYCTGRYWCVEYRAAVAHLCASVLWAWKRDKCMPAPTMHHNSETGETVDRYNGQRAGDYLRASFLREYGKGIAGRFFS
jgi:hypothetical protein